MGYGLYRRTQLPDRRWGPSSPLSNGYRWLLPRGVKLITRLHLVELYRHSPIRLHDMFTSALAARHRRRGDAVSSLHYESSEDKRHANWQLAATRLHARSGHRRLILIFLKNLKSLLVLHVSRLTFDISHRTHVSGRGTEQGCTQPQT
jgi:hypothetical protein